MVVVAALVGTSHLIYRWREIAGRQSGAVLGLTMPTKGGLLFVVRGDRGASIYAGDTFRGAIPLTEVTDVATGDFAPETLVSVGRGDRGNMRFSLDAGRTWRPSPAPPDGSDGTLTLSSDGRTWVWTVAGGSYRTVDYGFIWMKIDDLPFGATIVADRTATRRFYSVVGDELRISDDGAKSFSRVNGGAIVGLSTIYPTPGRTGDFWAVDREGLLHADPGRRLTRVRTAPRPQVFTAGRDTTYCFGEANGRVALFLTKDVGLTWMQIEGRTPTIQRMVADPSIDGRVFVATSDGSVLQGDPL